MTSQTDTPQGDSPAVEDSPSASKPRRRSRTAASRKKAIPTGDTAGAASHEDSSPAVLEISSTSLADTATDGDTVASDIPKVKASRKTTRRNNSEKAKKATPSSVLLEAQTASADGSESAPLQTSTGSTASTRPAKRATKGRASNTASAEAALAETLPQKILPESPSSATPDTHDASPSDIPAAPSEQKRKTRAARGKRKEVAAESVDAASAPAETDSPKTNEGNLAGDKGENGTGATHQRDSKRDEIPVHLSQEAKPTATDSDVDVQDVSANTTDTEEAPRRKSRRGRRGGRGRNRKNRTPQAETAGQEEDPSLSSAESGSEVALSPTTTQDEAPSLSSPESGEETDAPRASNGDTRRGKTAEKQPPEANAHPQEDGEPAKARKVKATPGNKRMYISVLPGEQVEVALTEENTLVEYYLDMLHQRKIKGNIYKGVIHNIDTNLQAAFVSYGTGKNGFLQIDEVHPEYWQSHHEVSKGKKFPPIQKALKAGQEVLVQVVKEPTGNKGAFLTTWLSLAGRFLVLTPGQEQIGVSRKVESDEERNRLREMMNGIDPGQGLGVIVRTVSAGTTKTTLKNDLQYLKRLWRDIRKKATESVAPALIHQEPGLSERAVRDYLTDDVVEIWVDNESVAETIRETVNLLFPRKKDLVRLHTDMRQSLWERFGLRRQLEQIYSREVVLPSGGRLVFDQTEALMAIDINSGKISGKGNFEAMSFKTNMEAAEGIARQLRLRDVGGQVVIDFIEMRDRKHVAEVEKALRQAMRNDRARHDVGHMSSFGLLELVRQRMGSSALAISMEPCPACGGTGQRRNLEWQALQSLRELRRLLRSSNGGKCVFEATPELGLYLLNHKRDTLRDMEQEFGKCLEIAIKP